MNVLTDVLCVWFRAHVTNTQLGQEEQSGGVRLIVRGDDSDGVDVPVRIVVAPKDTQVVRGNPVTELHCIANARFLFLILVSL